MVGLGHFQLRVNGNAVSDSVVDQPWSQYDKRIIATRFDLTPHLIQGENAVGIVLGNSFWKVGKVNDGARFSKTDAEPDFSEGQPYLVNFDATVELASGEIVRLKSESSWKAHEGPLTFSHIYAGEDYDARRVPIGWDRPGFDDTHWNPVVRAPAPRAVVSVASAPPMRVFETFKPTTTTMPAAGILVYSFPQNTSAFLRFSIKGDPGKTVRFKPCEYLAPNGRVKFTYTWGTGKEIWHDYTLRGGDVESHETLFCYVGCQYVEVTGAIPVGAPNPNNLPVLHSLELAHVRAANEIVGEFACDAPLQMSAHRLVDWSIRSNMAHVMTDCPHREKNGWQEQNWHMARAASYRFNLESYFDKICQDMRDTQLADGHVPTNCPNYLVGVPPHGFWNEAPEWGVASVLLPWHLYRWYGNQSALERAYSSMKRYTDYLSTQAKDGVIRSNLGDWYDFGHGQGDGPSKFTPSEVSATAVWAMAADTVSQAATVLGHHEDAAAYARRFEEIRSTFQSCFYDPQTAMVKNLGSCQAANATAICANLLPKEDVSRAVDAIVADVTRRNFQQTTGEVLHVFFVRALAEHGRNDVLHKVYARTEPGSYGHMVNSGLTTLPESWDGKPGTGNSMNHLMLGHLMEWHFAYVAGLRQAEGDVGWKNIIIEPSPGPLGHAEANFTSPQGIIRVNWSASSFTDGSSFNLTVTIPEGCTATVKLPSGSVETGVTGSRTYHSRSKRSRRS